MTKEQELYASQTEAFHISPEGMANEDIKTLVEVMLILNENNALLFDEVKRLAAELAVLQARVLSGDSVPMMARDVLH